MDGARQEATGENDKRNSSLPCDVITSATPEMQSPARACALYKRISAERHSLTTRIQQSVPVQRVWAMSHVVRMLTIWVDSSVVYVAFQDKC